MVDAEMSKRLNLISGGGNLTDAHAQIRALKKNKRWCLELCGFVVVPSALLIVILSTLYHQHTTVSTGGPATAADAVSIGNTWSSTSLSPAAEADPVDSAGKKIMFPKIVLLGDSLVSRSFSRDMGWGAMVADRFKRKVDVVVRGFSGYTSGMLKDTMPLILHTFIGQPIAAVVVLIGTYDVVAALDKQNIQAYEENLVEIVFSIQEKNVSAEQIILVSPPMNHKAGVTRRAEGPSANATLVKTDAYALSCMDISRQMMTRRLDLYHAMESTVLAHGETGHHKYLNADGIHLSEEGAKLMGEKLIATLGHLVNHLPCIHPVNKDPNGYVVEPDCN